VNCGKCVCTFVLGAICANRLARGRDCTRKGLIASKYTTLVPGAGIEPARLSARDFESRASTNSTTRATLSAATDYGTVLVGNRRTI
jgi:hypothetical protein